jgi:hypothetical protein
MKPILKLNGISVLDLAIIHSSKIKRPSYTGRSNLHEFLKNYKDN